MKMPFSIKTRTGLDEHDTEEQIKFLVEVSKHVSMITIHGRTVKQWYADTGNRDFIYELKQKVDKKCKVIGNGWIKSYEELEKYCQWNGVILDWVGIGQAAIGNPRIFTPYIPSREEIRDTILKHLDYMISYEDFFQKQKANYTDILTMPDAIEINVKNPLAITLAEFRKHLFQYVKWIPESKEFKQRVATISEYELLVKEIKNFFS